MKALIVNILSQNDVNRKPLGQIPLDGTCRIARTDGALTFEVRSSKNLLKYNTIKYVAPSLKKIELVHVV